MLGNGGNWLTISEAVEQLGISTRTIQRKIKSGELKARKKGRRIMVEVRQSSSTIELLEQQLSDLREANQYLRQQLAEKDKQISELHILMGSRALPVAQQGARRWWKPWQR
jgi:excisionase family DNA binding protein